MNSMTNNMSPLKVEILLWYYHSPLDFPNLDAPAINEAVDEFCDMGILKKSTGTSASALYECVREGLEVYVNAILAVPLPKQKWVCEDEKLLNKILAI